MGIVWANYSCDRCEDRGYIRKFLFFKMACPVCKGKPLEYRKKFKAHHPPGMRVIKNK